MTNRKLHALFSLSLAPRLMTLDNLEQQ